MSTTDYQNEQVPQPLADGIKTALARRGGCFLLKRVKVDNKGNKADRVLALVPCRGYIFSVRIPTKVEITFHFFEIQGIISMKPNQVLIETEKVVLSLTTASSNDADDIIFNIGLAIKKILPGLFSSHFLRRLTIDPPDRESRQLEEWQRQSNAEQGSCGGFSQIYACVCDQLNLPFRDEVQWDVDTIYFTHELQDLNLDDFSHLDSRDLVPIVATLEYSQWFTKLLCKDTKLNGDICEHIIRVIRNSSKLTALELEGASLKPEFMQKLAVALFDNHQSVLQSISLAGSAMDDKGVISFSSQLHHLIKGLYNLNLSRTALTLRGANSLCQALMGSNQIKATLTHLDLSGNILRADESSKLYVFLAQPNALINLNLSGTECLLETMFGALLRGCSQHLSHLNLSKNIFSNRKSRDILPSFSQFFNHSMALEKFSLSGTRLPPAAVREILLAVSSNQHLSSVSLDISSCELKSAGAKALIYCLEDVRNITSLDISDNGLDVEVANVIQALSKNRAIRHVYIGRNFSNVRPKAISTVMESIVLMIQDEEFWLKSLSLADSRLKTAAVIVASAICGAATLSHLDLSGNGMGDSGARMLAKALAVNTTLRTVAWDRNGTTAQGLYDVACALERNYTLHSMPIPVHDVSLAIKNQPEKTEAALHKIETLLLRNQGHGNASPERILRLQHCIAHDTTQQLVDQLCVKVQDQLRLLQNGSNADSTQRRLANTLLSQAKNTRVLLLALYKCSEEFWDSRNSINPVIEKLDGAASNVGQAIDSQLQVMVEAMHTTMGNLCSSLITDEGCTEVWHETGVGINTLALPRGFVQKVLVEQAGSELLKQIGEVRLDMSLKLTNQAVDRMLELLSQMQRQLGKQLEKQGQIMAATPEEDFASDGLRKALPSFRRSQTRSRKMRPLSVDFEVDAGTEKVSAKGKTGSNRQAKDSGVGGSVDPLVLPSEEDRQLEHITRSRPARPGRPGRPQHKTPPEQNKDQNGIDEHVDEGVDDFFSKNILPPELRNRPVEKAAKREDAPLTRLLKSNFLNILLHKRKRGDREQSQSHSSTNNNVVPPSNQSHEQYRPIQKTATWQESHDDADVLEEAMPVAAEGEAMPVAASVARNEERSKPETWRMFGVPVMPCLVSNDQLCSWRHKNEVQAISDGNTTSESQDEPPDKKKASLHRKEAMVVCHKRTLPSARIGLTSSKQPNFQDSIAPDKEGGSEMDPHKEVLPLPPQKSEPPVPFQVGPINPDPSNLLSVAEKKTPEPVYSMLQQKCQRPTSLIVQGEWGNISRNRIPSKKKMAQSVKRRSLDQLLDL